MSDKITTNIVPARNMIVYMPITIDPTSAGGIILADTDKALCLYGEVVAAGPGHYEAGKLVPMNVKEGDIIIVERLSRVVDVFDGERMFKVCRTTDLVGKLKGIKPKVVEEPRIITADKKIARA